MNDDINKDLGIVTAYAYAVSKGYTGTEDDFAALMADYAEVGERAEAAATAAAASATAASGSASDSAASATAAAGSSTAASTAAGNAYQAAQTATTKASEAAQSATAAAGSATTASTKASEAAQSALQAAGSATTAGASATAAQAAQTAAEAAQTAAETAQEAAEDAAESVSASAAQIAQNTADISSVKGALGATLITDTASGAIATFTDGSDGVPMESVVVSMEPIQSGSGNPSPDNIRPISGRSEVKVWREATYDTSADPALTVQLGQTVYGGTVDAVSGTLTVDRAMVDLGTLNWSAKSTVVANTYRYSALISNAMQSDSSGHENSICSMFPLTSGGGTFSANMNAYTIANNSELYVYYDAYNNGNATEFKTAMNGVQLCYELTQPVTVQLTAQQLTTLLGTNNVWSDGGNVSVEYVADTKQYIAKVIAAALA